MTTKEHIFSCLGEEGAEIAQITSKINRFGLNDTNVEKINGPDNQERLIAELNDLLGVARMLVESGCLPKDWQDTKAQERKIFKVARFINYAKQKGTICD